MRIEMLGAWLISGKHRGAPFYIIPFVQLSLILIFCALPSILSGQIRGKEGKSFLYHW